MKYYTTPAGSYPRLCENILNQPHVLIAGATGSGKSVLINSLIYTLLYRGPGQAELVLIDPKRVELVNYSNLPHTIGYSSETSDIINTITGTVDLMERRYSEMQKKRIKLYAGPDVYVIIDEYADLVTTSKKYTVPNICRIAQLGRAARIHLIVATQRPTRDIIDGQIKVNIDSRIALRCPTRQDSRNIINVPGAETLPRYGHGYYLTPDTMIPILVDIPMTPESELNRLIDHWTRQRPRPGILTKLKNGNIIKPWRY